MFPREPSEGHYQKSRKGQEILLSQPADADRHAVVSSCRLGPVGFHKVIPPGQIESIIAIGLTNNDGMMDAMHVGGDDKEAQ